MAHNLPTPSHTPSPKLQDFKITQLETSEEIKYHLDGLSALLCDCVNEPGSSLGFHSTLSTSVASSYWTSLSTSLSPRGNIHLFILTASPNPGITTSQSPRSNETIPPQILGTAQLSVIPKATHSHRAEVLKLLVSPSARYQGIARKLMEYLEDYARGIGKELLTLDTAAETGARKMYARLGWKEWGWCEGYAERADGRRGDVVFFRKDLVKKI